MHPNSDKDVYEVNEDNTRFSRTDTNVMAIDVLCTAFEKTSDDRYHEWLLKFLDSYIASSVGGIGGGSREQGYGTSFTWNYDILRITSLLNTSDNLNMLFQNYSDDIKEMGYEHLTVLFDEKCKYIGETENINVDYPSVLSNVYENDGLKIVYIYNLFKENASEGESWAQSIKVEFDENSLYQGRENTVNSDGDISVEQLLDKREHMVLMQRPLYIEIIEGNTKINIEKYEKEEIKLSLSGEVKAKLSIKNGIFPVSEEERYSANIKTDGNKTTLIVKKGNKISPQNGEITIDINTKEKTNTDKKEEMSNIGSWGNGSNPYKKTEDDKKETSENEKHDSKPQQEPIKITVDDFDDVSKNYWAYEPLIYLKQKEIMVGSGNKVRPDDYITRGEAVKIIVLAFNIENDKKTNLFVDAKDNWWEQYADAAASKGIVNGVDTNIFDGNGIITREMMAVMIKRAMDYSKLVFENVNKDSHFSDEDDISEYAYNAINSLYKMGVVNGMDNGNFAPKEKLTRSQAAQIVFNVLTKNLGEVTK